jgi:hypothetical protein
MKADDVILGYKTTIEELAEGDEFLYFNTVYRFNLRNYHGNFSCWNTADQCPEILRPYTKVVRLYSNKNATYYALIDLLLND